MTDTLRIALAQLNPKVGAIAENLVQARKALEEAEAAGADILMFTELYLTGYFPEDLLFKRQFVTDEGVGARDQGAERLGPAADHLER